MATMYRLFKEEHPETNIHSNTYSKIIKTLNIGFYKPKNVQCGMCTSYKNSKKPDEDVQLYNEHIDRKNMCRLSKEADKEKAKTDPRKKNIILLNDTSMTYLEFGQDQRADGEWYEAIILKTYNSGTCKAAMNIYHLCRSYFLTLQFTP